jgi:hypothetical protein
MPTSKELPSLTFSKQRPVWCRIGLFEILILYLTENWTPQHRLQADENSTMSNWISLSV